MSREDLNEDVLKQCRRMAEIIWAPGEAVKGADFPGAGNLKTKSHMFKELLCKYSKLIHVRMGTQHFFPSR